MCNENIRQYLIEHHKGHIIKVMEMYHLEEKNSFNVKNKSYALIIICCILLLFKTALKPSVFCCQESGLCMGLQRYHSEGRKAGRLGILWTRCSLWFFRLWPCEAGCEALETEKTAQISLLFLRHKTMWFHTKLSFFIWEIKNMAFYIYKLLFLYKYKWFCDKWTE